MVTVLNTVDTGHEDMIHDAKMDYCGIRLATCSSDQSVKIYDVRNGSQTLIADLRGHEGPVWQVAWAHPKFGNLLASCSYDRKVIIWKETNEKWVKFHEYSNHDSSVNSVAWAPHELGLMLACGSSDGCISILTNSLNHWETSKIVNAHSIGCNTVSWAPATIPNSVFDPAAVAGSKPVKRLVSGGCDNLVKIWREDNDNWVEEAKLERHSDWVRDVAWAPSIGLPTTYIASGSQDRRVIVWSKQQGAEGGWRHCEVHTFEDVVWSVSWSLTGNILAVTGGDNKVTLWRRDSSSEDQWTCISDVNKGHGQLVGSEQRAL